MTLPVRTCIRCRLDSIRKTVPGRSYRPIGHVRAQCTTSQHAQLVQQRSYATGLGETGQEPPKDESAIETPVEESLNPESLEYRIRFRRKDRPLIRWSKSTVKDIDVDSKPRPYTERGRVLGPDGPSVVFGGLITKEKKPWTFPMDSPFVKRIQDLKESDIGKKLYVKGWFSALRPLGPKLVFATIMHEGSEIQITFDKDSTLRDPSLLTKIPLHTPVEVCGFLRYKGISSAHYRHKGYDTIKKPDGSSETPVLPLMEILLDDIKMLGPPPVKPVIRGTVYGPEERYMALRTDTRLLDGIILRSKVSQICRCHLMEEGFLEIETPLLFKSTPEGAREFLVPTRKPNYMYALPQSPQQYKQILMAGGISKYFQIAKCFRDEDLRADRQPEFTQLDLEMGFSNGNDVRRTVTRLLKRIWSEVKGLEFESFHKLSYHMAMNMYGSDKPDLRYDLQISSIDGHIHRYAYPGVTEDRKLKFEIFTVPDIVTSNSNFSKIYQEVVAPSGESIEAFAGDNPRMGLIYYKDESKEKLHALLSRLIPFARDSSETVVKIADELIAQGVIKDKSIVAIGRRKKEFNPGGSTLIGQTRTRLAHCLINRQLMPPLKGYKFVWIHSFPMFTKVERDDVEPGQSAITGYKSTHHPFTAPVAGHEEKLLIKPWETLADHFDIVCNGVELGGGSTRIHDPEMQATVLKDVLGVPPSQMKKFNHLIEMLASGCPPHAGLALGFDRLVAMLHGSESIRDVIAFPKNNSGVDQVVHSPSLVTDKQLEEYGVMLKTPPTSEEIEKEETPIRNITSFSNSLVRNVYAQSYGMHEVSDSDTEPEKGPRIGNYGKPVDVTEEAEIAASEAAPRRNSGEEKQEGKRFEIEEGARLAARVELRPPTKLFSEDKVDGEPKRTHKGELSDKLRNLIDSLDEDAGSKKIRSRQDNYSGIAPTRDRYDPMQEVIKDVEAEIPPMDELQVLPKAPEAATEITESENTTTEASFIEAAEADIPPTEELKILPAKPKATVKTEMPKVTLDTQNSESAIQTEAIKISNDEIPSKDELQVIPEGLEATTNETLENTKIDAVVAEATKADIPPMEELNVLPEAPAAEDIEPEAAESATTISTDTIDPVQVDPSSDPERLSQEVKTGSIGITNDLANEKK